MTSSLLLFLFVATAYGQRVLNGQIFTAGLAIVDAPAVNSTQHTGSILPIAIDVSGDGRLNPNAYDAGNNTDQSTRYDSLNIFLVSNGASQAVNYTVSNTTSLLTQEPGSTVKHLSFLLPTCLGTGDYNLTFYEAAFINGTGFYSITPIPFKIQSANGIVQTSCNDTTNTGNMNATNPIQFQPQNSSPPNTNPWIGASGTLVNYPDQNNSGLNLPLVTPFFMFFTFFAMFFTTS